MRQLGAASREKHIYKGSDPGSFLSGSVKGVPQGIFLLMKEGLVFLDKGPQRLNAAKVMEIAFEKAVGDFGALGGLAAGALSTVLANKEERETMSISLAEFKSRPGTFIIPYTEIIETRHHKHGVFDYLFRFKRESPDGHIDEYWMRPADPQYPLLFMQMRANAEKELIAERLFSERGEISSWLPQMADEFARRHSKGITEDDQMAFKLGYFKTLMERLEKNGTSLLEVREEAQKQTEATFSGTPVYTFAATIQRLT